MTDLMTETKFGGNHSHMGCHESCSFLQMLIFYVVLMPQRTHEVCVPIVPSLHKQRRRNNPNAKELALSKSTVEDNFSIMSTCVFFVAEAFVRLLNHFPSLPLSLYITPRIL